MIGANRFSRLRVLAVGLVMIVSCATAPTRSGSAGPREKDSASEKVAAQRAVAAHELPLEQEDERWGVEAARERRRQRDEARARRQQAESAGKGVDVTTPAGR